MNQIATYFAFEARGARFRTELLAGLTTFLVLAATVLTNADVLSHTEGAKMNAVSVLVAGAIVAGLGSIAVGLIGRLPVAIAASLGLSAIVSFELAPGLGATGAMGMVVVEGLGVLVLVALGFREPLLRIVPAALRGSLGIGIGFLLVLLGLFDGGLISTQASKPPVYFVYPVEPASFVAIVGILVAIGVAVWRSTLAGLVAIVVAGVLALVAGVTSLPDPITTQPALDTLGGFDVAVLFDGRAPLGAVLLTTFVLIVTHAFSSLATVAAVSDAAELTDADGRVPGLGRTLAVDALATVAGGVLGAGPSGARPESLTGVAGGGRTGLTAVVAGLLFLPVIALAPLITLASPLVVAPAVIITGLLLVSRVAGLDLEAPEDRIPAVLTMALIPLTFDISAGVGAGFVAWTLLRVVRGRAGEVHPVTWLITGAFVVFFLRIWVLPYV